MTYLSIYYIDCALNGFPSADIKTGESLSSSQLLGKIVNELKQIKSPINDDDLISYVLNFKKNIESNHDVTSFFMKKAASDILLESLTNAGYKKNIKQSNNHLKEMMNVVSDSVMNKMLKMR